MRACVPAVRVVLIVMVGGIFIAAGVGKANDPMALAPALRFLSLAEWVSNEDALLVVAATVGGSEVALGLALLFFSSWRLIWGLALLVLSAYAAALLFFLAHGDAPSCGCLGFPLADADAEWQNVAGVIRNAGLLLASVLIFKDPGGPAPALSGSGDRGGEARRVTREARLIGRGFTLVELLVALVVIAVLIGLALSLLAGARGQARLTDVLSTLRQIGAATTSYTTDFDGAFPYLGVPGQPEEGLFIDGARLQTSAYQPDGPAYFMQTMYYANLLVPTWFASRNALEGDSGVWLKSKNDVHFITPYRMTATAFAAPEYWVGEEPPESLSLFRPVRTGEARFPSNKGLILHQLSGAFNPSGRSPAPDAYLAAAVDGSAATHPMPSEEELEANSVDRPYGAPPLVTMTTVGGMAGRDF